MNGDTPDGEGRSIGSNGHESRVDTLGRGRLLRAWIGEGGLRDGVVFGMELKVNRVTSIDGDAGGAEGQLAVRANSDSNVGGSGEGSGRSDKDSGGEAHFKGLKKAWVKEVSGDDY